MDGTLLTELQALRVKAGNPSIRVIGRLVENQGRKNPMARSTIQDKLSGKSLPDLAQVLSIVEALSEYASSIGAPLTPLDTGIQAWRDRFARQNATGAQGSLSDRTVASLRDVSEQLPWNLAPLRTAGMLDVIAIIDGSRGKPVSDWLPEVVWHLRQAGMDYGGFLAVAARQEPKDLMETVAAFNDHFKGEGDPWGGASSTNDETRHLLAIAARIKEPEKTPIFVVGLRRAGMDEYVESFLSGVARNKPVRSLRAAVQVLKSASLRGDATRLLKIIGRERGVKDAAHTIRHFWGNGSSDDAVVILQGVGEGESARLVQIYQEVSSMSLGGMRTLDEIVRGVPEFLRDNKASELEALGHSDIAEKLRAIGDSNPPF